MKKLDIAVVGEIYVDHIFAGFSKWPEPGEEVFTDEYVQEVGGGAAITACALTHLGRTVNLIGVIGKNEASWIERRLSDFGVSGSGLHRGDGCTGTTASVSTKMDRSFFTYVGENAELEKHLAGGSILQHLMEARHVHFAMPLSVALADRLLEKLAAADCTTSLDVGHQIVWLQDAANLKTCSKVQYLLPNEREARILCSGDALAYLDFTRRKQWPSGIVKLGAAGAMMRTDDRPLVMQSPNIDVVDTTGAGDAFDAGFIDGLLDEEAPEECMRRACICGGLSTRRAGALRGLPTRDELKGCYEESYG